MSIPLHLLRLSNQKLWYSSSLGHGTSHSFLCLCFEDFIPHQDVFLKISQTHLDKWPHVWQPQTLSANTLPFFLKLKCSVSRQFSPQARWRPFPHHLWGESEMSLCPFHPFHLPVLFVWDNHTPYQNQGHWFAIRVWNLGQNIWCPKNDEFRYTKNAAPSDPQIPKHQTIQMIRVLNPCMNGLKYLSSTSESHWNNKCTHHHLHLFVTKLLHPGMISPNSTKSYGTLQLYDPVTCPPSRCWHNAK